MERYEVTIKGLEPGLLMRKFSAETLAELAEQTKPSKVNYGTAREQAEQNAYRLKNGELYQPAEHIYQALVKSAGGFLVKGQGKKSYRDVVKGMVIIEPEHISHGRKDFEIDMRAVRIQRARQVRFRPLLRNWQLSFRIIVGDEDLLPGEVLKAILVRSGVTNGLGDYRPRFGRFVVTKFKKVAG
jgi:hypothetical protein